MTVHFSLGILVVINFRMPFLHFIFQIEFVVTKSTHDFYSDFNEHFDKAFLSCVATNLYLSSAVTSTPEK